MNITVGEQFQEGDILVEFDGRYLVLRILSKGIKSLLVVPKPNGILTVWRHSVAIQCMSPYSAFGTLYGDKGSDYIYNEF